jgi:hypothetical protein
MTDISNGIGFVAVTPCRIADTRGLGFSGQAGPPLLNTGTRTFQITGTVVGVPAQCGIPPGADAVSFQFTIVSPNSNGNLIAWPAGGAVPTISVLNWDASDTALGNGTIVPVSAAGALSVRINAAVGTATGHLVIDVNGYFTDTYPDNNVFVANSTTGGAAILASNTSTVDGAHAIRATISSTTPGPTSTAVRGINNGTGTSGIGVWGSQNGSGFGVLGSTEGGFGVYGRSLSTGSSGYGVRGRSEGTTAQSAGVYGEGFTNGVVGSLMNSMGNSVAAGVLGTTFAGILGVYSAGNALITGNLTVQGGSTVVGVKSFIEPHPHDASKEIRYVSLEGPHAEVYFRGTAQVSRGVTRIEIPEDFRFVADPATYSTLVTPVGGMATVGVVSEGEEGIVVQASRSLKVHYVVYAERRRIKNPDPIVENEHFRPAWDEDSFASMPESFRELLKQNGTLNPDGSVNRETARRLGWDKDWVEPPEVLKRRP